MHSYKALALLALLACGTASAAAQRSLLQAGAPARAAVTTCPIDPSNTALNFSRVSTECAGRSARAGVVAYFVVIVSPRCHGSLPRVGCFASRLILVQSPGCSVLLGLHDDYSRKYNTQHEAVIVLACACCECGAASPCSMPLAHAPAACVTHSDALTKSVPLPFAN
jgi:hypothetical protein